MLQQRYDVPLVAPHDSKMETCLAFHRLPIRLLRKDEGATVRSHCRLDCWPILRAATSCIVHHGSAAAHRGAVAEQRLQFKRASLSVHGMGFTEAKEKEERKEAQLVFRLTFSISTFVCTAA